MIAQYSEVFYTAASDSSMVSPVLATVAYFVLAIAILGVAFLVQDILTPGDLRRQTFVEHLPNAGVMVGSQVIAIGLVVATAIATTEPDLASGLIHVTVYSLVGLFLQSLFLVLMEVLVPGRFRDLINDPKLRSSAVVTGVALVVVGAINAVCLT
ncbi:MULTISPECIES: DUF350 domain-containing protein [Corynebacterium]|uniref:DUF350 domain-containing protein n=1 Tax=Corynebacterium TaxID=1716 RepID=UPI000A67091A|nr:MULTISPECIES: DUF350 domain-containing protein [Corynebacterium]